METPPIIERFDVAEQILSGFPARVVAEVMNTFRFERSKEALHRRIVVPGADAVHADLDVLSFQEVLVDLPPPRRVYYIALATVHFFGGRSL